MNNYYNPYMSMSQNRYGGFQGDFGQRCEIVKVNGENGARAYPLPPNSNILLLDETAPIVWLAQTDGAGYKTVMAYSITPYQSTTPDDYTSLEARIKKLEDMINEPNLKSNKNRPTVTATE